MPLEGILAVQARIGEIRRLAAPSGPTSVGSAGAPAASPSFDAVLAAVSAPAGAAPTTAGGAAAPAAPPPARAAALTPAEVGAPGAYGRLEPPPELARFGNGRIPADELAGIGGGHRLHAPAAEAFTRLQADARAAGVTVGVTDSYRDHAAQVSVAARKGLYSEGGLAARPGTSTHGWGLSVDLALDAGAQRWMREHGWRYGFVEDVRREPWHWTYRPAT